MNVGGRWLFGRPNEIFIEGNKLIRRIYETEQVYNDEIVLTRDEFMLCYNEWVKGDKNERPSD